MSTSSDASRKLKEGTNTVCSISYTGLKQLQIHNLIYLMNNATVKTFHHTWEDCFFSSLFVFFTGINAEL